MVPRDLSKKEKYNYARGWLKTVLTYCQTGQKVTNFNYTLEGNFNAVFRKKENDV